MEKLKTCFKNLKKQIIKMWNNNELDIIVPIIGLILLLISSFILGFGIGILILIMVNLPYFGIMNYINRQDNEGSESNMTKKKKKTTKKVMKKKLKIVLLIMLICFIVGIIGIIGFFAYIVINAPDFNEDLLYVSDPTIVYSKDGDEIAKLGAEKRVVLEYDELPEVLIDAIVATEDSRFFEHNGVDWARFLKASFFQLLGKSEAGGASTLTMQVSKNTYTSNEASGIEGIIRKFTDVYVSLAKIEKNYTKKQIMEFYVNSYWLGSNSYGVEQISLTYFGKSAKDLNLAEAAMIAGLFQAPGKYNPYSNPEATETRRQTVLKLMKRHGYITKDEYEVAKKLTVEDLVIPKEESAMASGEISEYQSFIDTVVEEVEKKTGYNAYTTPMEIYTTLNTDIQDYVNDIMSGESYDWENDVVQAGVAIIDIKDGSVSAVGGNRKIDRIDGLNYATDITRQIGSTAKPLYDYGPGIEYNNWSTYNILVDEPITYSDGNPINNWNGAYEGFETMRIALKGSRNIPALKAFKANNKQNIIEFVTNLGLTPEIYSCEKGYTRKGKICTNNEDPTDVVEAKSDTTLHEAHAIGGYNGESPLSLAAAYAAFANQGVYTQPYTFTKLIYQDSGEEYVNDIKTNKAMSEETAYMISDMLATTATQAMGWYYNINGIRYAAKTGTTNYDYDTLKEHGLEWTAAVNDLWTVGYNTEYAIGVWYGYNRANSEHYNVLSSGQHERLFQAVGKKVFTNKDYFKKPSGVVSVELEKDCPEPTLPSEYTPSDMRITELFIKGTEPTNVSTRYSKLNTVENLTVETKDDTITIKWKEVETPEINTEKYLKEYYDPVYENDNYLNAYVSSRLSHNKNNIGALGYNVYLKDKNGDLKLLDFVTTNEYKYKVKESGEYTFVVKTTYSIFKSNMSDGKSITTDVKIKSPIIPDDDKEGNDKPTTNTQSTEKQE